MAFKKKVLIIAAIFTCSYTAYAQTHCQNSGNCSETHTTPDSTSGANSDSFTKAIPVIEQNIRRFYANEVFRTGHDEDYNITDICRPAFLKRLRAANTFDAPGYAIWLLRSGMQDGDDTPSEVLSVTPRGNHTVVVEWTDMGHIGQTTLTMVESEGAWKIDNATVPDGYPPL